VPSALKAKVVLLSSYQEVSKRPRKGDGTTDWTYYTKFGNNGGHVCLISRVRLSQVDQYIVTGIYGVAMIKLYSIES
jgi:hypothetical protein